MAHQEQSAPDTANHGFGLWIGVVGLVYLLLVGVGIIGAGFKWISGGAEGAAQIFAFASNPIVGVILGTLATALVQSSSTVTSVIVGLVAGGVPVEIAIPMIMGANMGTTITNTIVSLGNLREKLAFSRAFQAATVHDFFNLYTILIFLPIEVLFHPLEKMSGALAGVFVGAGDASIKGLNFVGAATKPIAGFVVDTLEFIPAPFGPLLAIAIGIALVIGSVLYLGNLLRAVMTGRAKGMVDAAIGRGPVAGIASGTVVTIAVQSSSTTTSLVVPLAGAGVLTLRQVFPFTLGANIGTTVTALLAATSVTGEFQNVALQIALVHLLYNCIAVTFFISIPFMTELPIRSAIWLGERVEQNRGWALAYIVGVFFVLPGLVFGGEDLMGEVDTSALQGSEETAISTGS